MTRCVLSTSLLREYGKECEDRTELLKNRMKQKTRNLNIPAEGIVEKDVEAELTELGIA